MTAKLISAFVFATRIVQSLFYVNPKFQASSHLLWLYSLLCVGPGRTPRRPGFSQRGSYSNTAQISMRENLCILISTRFSINSLYSKKKAMNRNWRFQKPNPALKTKTGNKYYKWTKDKENIWPNRACSYFPKGGKSERARFTNSLFRPYILPKSKPIAVIQVIFFLLFEHLVCL